MHLNSPATTDCCILVKGRGAQMIKTLDQSYAGESLPNELG